MGRSYALGGGGSGDLETDRSSFAKPNGLSRSRDGEETTALVATPIPFGRHEIIREHARGAHGREQSCFCVPSLSCSAPCIAIPGMSRMSDADASAEVVELQL